MPHRRRTESNRRKRPQPAQVQQPAKAIPGPYDFRQIGPISEDGVVASDFPDHGRGSVNTDAGKELARKSPKRTGENATGEVGMRAMPDIADSKQHGYRKRN